jgi:hypothetical protein
LGVLDSIADKRKILVVDFAAVPFPDSSAANTHRARNGCFGAKRASR